MEIHQQIEQLEEEISAKKKQLAELRKQVPFEEVGDFTFRDKTGKEVQLSSLFNGHNELIVIHNMGKGCAYCTLWADGFNGMTADFESRAGFVLISPDNYEDMAAFADKRGWQFNILSSKENTFKKDLGFQKDNAVSPGISILQKTDDGKILHTSRAFFGPGDNYCNLWDVFDLLNDNATKWTPAYRLKN